MKKFGEALQSTAEIHNVTESYVRLILNGKRKNEAIVKTYNTLKAKTEKLVEKLKTN